MGSGWPRCRRGRGWPRRRAHGQVRGSHEPGRLVLDLFTLQGVWLASVASPWFPASLARPCGALIPARHPVVLMAVAAQATSRVMLALLARMLPSVRMLARLPLLHGPGSGHGGPKRG